MDIKKLILTGSCAAALSLVAACSDDSSSSAPVVTPDSSVSGTSEGAEVPSSSTGSVPSISSSSVIADNAEPQMACSEIMYNAADASPLEWVEIYIAGGMDMNSMADFELHLSGSVDYTFPAEPLKKGEYIVVASDTSLFRQEYPNFAGRLFGNFVGKMPNEGDVVNVKVRGEGDVTCAFGSEPPWPSIADGMGRSLVYIGGNAAQPNSWGASSVLKGNPGVGNDEVVKASKVRINEIMPNAGLENAWMELYNAGDEDVDVAGWTLEVKRRKQTLTITSGVVPAHGYLLLNAVDNFSEELVVSNQGGEFYLRGLVEGEESSIWVPASIVSSGIVDLADGSTAQGPMAMATPGAANSPLQIGSVRINEIHYHPAEAGGASSFEYLEIVNSTAAPIVLYNSTVKRGWKIEGVGMEFGAMDIIPANGMILLISDSLAADTSKIRSGIGISDDVPIKLFSGKLSNRGETIAIKEPFAKEEDPTNPMNTKYFYVWHDATLYSDTWPGLAEADGAGFSLQRKDFSTMGYESSAWIAAKPTPGK